MNIKLFDVYRCSWCAKYCTVEIGNHHPWCGCGSDQFDWNDGLQKVTEAEAEKFIKDNE